MIDIHYGDEFDKLAEEWGSGSPKLLRAAPSMKVLPQIAEAEGNIDDSWENDAWDSPPTVLPKKEKARNVNLTIQPSSSPEKAPPAAKRDILQKRPLLANNLDDFDDLDISKKSEVMENTPRADGLIKKQKKSKATKLPISLDNDLDDWMNTKKPSRANEKAETRAYNKTEQ